MGPKHAVYATEFKSNLTSALFDAGMAYDGPSAELMTEAGKWSHDPITELVECLRHDSERVFVLRLKLKAGAPTVAATVVGKGTKQSLADAATTGKSVQVAINAYFTAKHDGRDPETDEFVGLTANCTFTICSCAVLSDREAGTPWMGGSPATTSTTSYAAAKAAVEAEIGRVTPDSESDDGANDDDDVETTTTGIADDDDDVETTTTRISKLMKPSRGPAPLSPKRPCPAKETKTGSGPAPLSPKRPYPANDTKKGKKHKRK